MDYLFIFHNLSTSDLGDPIAVGRDLSVDSRVVRVSAANTPGDDAEDLSVPVEGTAGVTLARVDTTLRETSADLVGGNASEAGVAVVAVGL